MDIRRPKVLIAGAPTGCWTNAGDEAILAATAQDLREAMPGVELTVVSSNPAGALTRYGVKELPNQDILQLFDAARTTDLMILVGGSIFFDYWGFDPASLLTAQHGGLAFFTGFAVLAKLVNKPLMIYAVGVGPLQSAAGVTFTQIAFEQAQVVTVRDAASRALLYTLGVNAGSVRVTADPAFNFRAIGAGQASELIERLVGAAPMRPLMGVALRNWDIGVKQERWEREVATALDQFIELRGGTILFTPFHRQVDWPLTADLAVAEEVRERMRKREHTIVWRGDYLPEEKSGVLQVCDLVLGMRLHAAIFAATGSVPTVALSYDPKVAGVMADLGAADDTIDLRSLMAEQLTSRLDQAWQCRAQLRAQLQTRQAGLIHLCRENARLASELACNLTDRSSGMSALTMNLVKELAGKNLSRPREVRAAAQALLAQTSTHRQAATFTNPKMISTYLKRAKADADLRSKPRSVRLSRSSRKSRVAILTNRLLDWETAQPRFGGAERYCLTLGELLFDLGFDVTFFQVANRAFESDYYGFRVIALPPRKSFSEFQHGVCNEFYRLTADYDHVIYNMPNYASGQIRDDALVVCHGIWFDHHYAQPPIEFRTREWFRHLYRIFSQPRKVISVDTNSINVLRSFWPDLAPRLTYLPNWVDTNLFHPPSHRDPTQITVLFPRRAEIIRGTRLLEPVLNRLAHPCRVRWVGEEDGGENDLIKALGARDSRLEFHSATFEEMPHFYQEADICVIPSIGSEGTSLACLEGLASGCAVIATTVGGLPELIQPGINGLLVDPDAAQIAASINHLITDAGERGRLQQDGRRMAERFRLEVWQERWCRVFAELGWLTDYRLPVRVMSFHSVSTPLLQPDDANHQMSSDHLPNEPRGSIESPADSLPPYDVICFSIIDWEFRYQRPQQLMTQFAREGHRVFYMSTSRFLPLGKLSYEVVPLRDNIWEVRLAAPEPIDVYREEISAAQAQQLLIDLKALRDSFQITRAVSVVQVSAWSPAADLARTHFGWPIVYDCMDDWEAFPGMKEQDSLLAAEQKLVRTADLLSVSSQKLWDKWSEHNPNAVLARNAADFEFFHDAPPNPLLPEAEQPVIGFFGAIADWFDLELMMLLAQQRPEYNFVLVGDVFGHSIEGLQALPNVRLTGFRPYELMPSYLRHFDVCLVPFIVNEATAAMDVVKFYEYISQGKPVVATRLPELLPYDEYLYLADDHDDFIRKLDRAVCEDDLQLRERRVALARINTWQARLRLIKVGISRAEREVGLVELLKGNIENSSDLQPAAGSLRARKERSASKADEINLHRYWKPLGVYWLCLNSIRQTHWNWYLNFRQFLRNVIPHAVRRRVVDLIRRRP